MKNTIKIDAKAGYVEYKMSEEMANDLLANRKAVDNKMTPNEYLCKVVNDNFGLKGHCTKVLLF